MLWISVSLKFGLVFFLCLPLVWGAQCRAEESDSETTPFQWGGAAEVGYRWTDVEGENRYREVVNLEQGFRLFNLSAWFKDPERKGAADDVRFRVNSIGDPFPSGRLDIKKSKVYQLSASYREYEFFFDRQDLPPPPNPFLISTTDNHDFNQKRRRGNLSLSLFPAEDVRFDLGYSTARREGEARVPRVFTFVPNLRQDFDERFNEYFLAASFPLRNWNLYVKQSYWTFENNDIIDQPPTLVERRNEEVGTYVSTVKAHSRFGDRWDFDAGYIYAHSRGDARQENIRGEAPPTVEEGTFSFDTHVLESGLSYLLRKDLILHFDYRFHTFDQDGRADSDPLIQQTFVVSDYRLHAHTGTFQVEYIPEQNLTVRAGYRAQHRNITAENFNANRHDGAVEPANTEIFAHGWVASADWKPYKYLSLYGEYEGTVFDNPYTRISPEDQHAAKARVRYDTPIKDLTLKGAMLWKRKTNPDQQFRLDVEDYVISATYQPQPLPGLSFDGSFTYEKIRDKKDIVNDIATQIVDPTAPLFTPFVFDSDAVIYSGGIGYENIYKGLCARFGGTVARTSKENHQKYAQGVVSFWYKLKLITPILSFERSSLTDRENPNDSFSANLVTFSLRKDF